jgi:hypothetical protein
MSITLSESSFSCALPLFSVSNFVVASAGAGRSVWTDRFGTANYVRYTHEILFAFNCALPATLVVCATTSFPLFLPLKYRLNAAFHRSGHSELGADCALLLLATIAAMSIFLLLRIIARNWVAETILRWVAGVTSFAAVPICWLLLIRRGEPTPFEATAMPWSLAEVGVCIILALAWSSRKWIFGPRVFVLLVTLHLVFWCRLFLRSFYNPGISILLLVAGACSSFAWARYVSAPRRHPSRAE